MNAADFGAILLAPKSFGTHFTLKSEKHWTQPSENDEDVNAAGTIFPKLFQLNLTTLKNGVGHLPFYIRNGCPKELFTDQEITRMEQKVSYMGEKENTKPLNTYSQNILSLLRSNDQEGVKKSIVSEATLKKGESTEGSSRLTTDLSAGSIRGVNSDLLDEIFDDLNISTNTPKTIVKTEQNPATSKKTDNVSKSTVEVKHESKSTVKSDKKQEDIQDWLDDILNEG